MTKEVPLFDQSDSRKQSGQKKKITGETEGGKKSLTQKMKRERKRERGSSLCERGRGGKEERKRDVGCEHERD